VYKEREWCVIIMGGRSGCMGLMLV
jgi:hypothetical protein